MHIHLAAEVGMTWMSLSAIVAHRYLRRILVVSAHSVLGAPSKVQSDIRG
jgi:hypothetical protein